MGLRQRQIELFDPTEARTLPGNSRAHWTLNRKISGGRLDQSVYRLDQLDFVLRHINPNHDTYMSQAFFARPNRRALNVQGITHCWVDLDIYKLPCPPNPGTAGIFLRQYCADNLIPPPSVVISSGRGLYLKWYFDTPVPRAAAGRVVAVNRALVQAFSEWGSDPACVDVSRILRVVGTVNTKTGQAVSILHQEERDGAVVTYEFNSLADEILPYTLEEVREFKAGQKAKYEERGKVFLLARERARAQKSTGSRKAFSRFDWCWKIVEDLRMLSDIRHGGTVSEGERDMFAHIGGSMLSHVLEPHQLWYELQTWSRLILPEDYCRRDLMAHSSSLLQKVREEGAGYKYRTSTMIERLSVTPDEERRMTALISSSEKRRRDRENTERQRREAGVQGRAEYLKGVSEGSAEAMRPWEAEGVSRATWYRNKKR